MKIEYYRKTHYGVDHRYIVDPTIANAVAKLTDKKTVGPNHLAALESLGFTVTEVLPPREPFVMGKTY